MIRPALLVNPHARASKRDPSLGPRLAQELGENCIYSAPDGMDALHDTLRQWSEAEVDTVVVHGGDGTLHRTATALMTEWSGPLPQFAVIPGGTMNIVAASTGTRGRPLSIARALANAHTTTRRWLMKIEGPETPQYGFLFGNGIISAFLEVCYEGTPPSPLKAAQILVRGAGSAMIRGPLARRLTRPFHGTLTVGTQQWGPTDFTAIAAGTVQQIGLGFRAFPKSESHPGTIHLVGITGSVLDLALELPRIYFGRGVHRTGNFECVDTALLIDSDEPIGFMIDGDFHTAPNGIRITTGPPIDFVLP